MPLRHPGDAIARCQAVATARLSPPDSQKLVAYLGRIARGEPPPRRGRGFAWRRIADVAGVPLAAVHGVRDELRNVFALANADGAAIAAGEPPEPDRSRRGDPDVFSRALDLQIRAHGDTIYSLHEDIVRRGGRVYRSTLAMWRRGAKLPQTEDSLKILRLIEERYRLPAGYFAAKRGPGPKALARRAPDAPGAARGKFAWHLPDDFSQRSPKEQHDIVEWVREVIITGATDYRRYQSAALRRPYGLQFPELNARAGARTSCRPRAAPSLVAPAGLAHELAGLVAFKTSTLTPAGYRRSGLWGAETAAQRVEHLGLLFGALAAPEAGPVRGKGVAHDALTLGLLAFPGLWDWYVQWREARRGFYTNWEVDLLVLGAAVTRQGTGWVRQNRDLAARVRALPGLVGPEEVLQAQADWEGRCEATHQHCLARLKEIQKVARVHRDPFEPILVVLEADSPLAEYRKITDEILRRIPDSRRYPKAAAEAVRAFLMLRFGLHTGLRQRNLRELLVAGRGAPSRTDQVLVSLRAGELRWSDKDSGWEVYVPAAAFKNARSSFFGDRPYRLLLPDLGGLYGQIDAYLTRHRAALLAGAEDPGTFFVKSAKTTSRSAAFSSAGFYTAWRLAIQRYGIFNPYTGRGAIRGLLPHGPHNVRDVLATHILKQTGSYEQASYAIQDTPQMVAMHYGRFLPNDKAALAAKVLNKVWA